MFSLKKTSMSFVIGFAISLIAGIGGGVSFIVLLVRAILSGVFFAALVTGAMILVQKYLLNGESLSEQPKDSVAQAGTNVDIMLDDDDLPDSTSAPGFALDASVNYNSANDEEGLIENLPNSFQTGKLDSIAASGGDPVAEKKSDALSQKNSENDFSSEKKSFSNAASRSVSATELDMLPDIENLVLSNDAVSVTDDDEVIQDAVFAETGETKPIVPADFSDMDNVRDIAASIQTILKNDT